MKKYRTRIHKTDNQGRLFLGQCYSRKECKIEEYVDGQAVRVVLEFEKPSQSKYRRKKEIEVVQEYEEGVTLNLEVADSRE